MNIYTKSCNGNLYFLNKLSVAKSKISQIEYECFFFFFYFSLLKHIVSYGCVVRKIIFTLFQHFKQSHQIQGIIYFPRENWANNVRGWIFLSPLCLLIASVYALWLKPINGDLCVYGKWVVENYVSIDDCIYIRLYDVRGGLPKYRCHHRLIGFVYWRIFNFLLLFMNKGKFIDDYFVYVGLYWICFFLYLTNPGMYFGRFD